jgi:hypothetical protein
LICWQRVWFDGLPVANFSASANTTTDNADGVAIETLVVAFDKAVTVSVRGCEILYVLTPPLSHPCVLRVSHL